jgi:uncharacterized protein YuzE
MNYPKMIYFAPEDILHLTLADEPEANSIELSPHITAELNDKGELIGLEITKASSFIRDFILETAQLKLLQLSSYTNFNNFCYNSEVYLGASIAPLLFHEFL